MTVNNPVCEKKERRVFLSVILLYAVFVAKSITNLAVLSIVRRAFLDPYLGVWVLLQMVGSYLFLFDSGLSQIVMNLTGAGNEQETKQ